MVICLERDADLHMAQLMPLPLTVSCFNEIQIGFTFLVTAHLGSPGKRAVIRVCVCPQKRVTIINQSINDQYTADNLMLCNECAQVRRQLAITGRQLLQATHTHNCCCWRYVVSIATDDVTQRVIYASRNNLLISATTVPSALSPLCHALHPFRRYTYD